MMVNSSELAQKLAANAELLSAILQTGTFTGAAEQVGIVQPAVSQRIRSLEEAIAMPLFDRTTRKMALTPVGEIVCRAAAESAAHWNNIVDRIDGLRNPRLIRISTSSSLAMKWLIPSLPRLKEQGVDVVIEADDRVVDLSQGSEHLAVRYGLGPYPGAHSEILCPAKLVPVAGPRSPIEELEEAMVRENSEALISDRSGELDGTGFSWTTYFKARSWNGLSADLGVSFARADLVLQAAICGMGVALGRTLLIEDDIRNGFLVPKGPSVATNAKYWIVTTASFSATPTFSKIRGFLKAEVERSARGFSL